MSVHSVDLEIKNRKLLFLFPFLFAIALTVQGSWVGREDFMIFSALLVVMSLCYVGMIYHRKRYSSKELIVFSAVLASICLFSDAPLSTDYYRFLWDGEMISQGINPYEYRPDELIHTVPYSKDPYFLNLQQGMGELSARHYSCYPVVNQFYFWIAAVCSNSIAMNLIALRLVILVSIVLGFVYLSKLLHLWGFPTDRIWLLVWNPLFVIETIQNVHFEGVMLSFVFASFYYILQKQYLLGSFLFAAAIHIKLIPLLFLPFLWKQLGARRGLGVVGLIVCFTLLLFWILLTKHNASHFLSSLSLYFESFEFNSSVFRLVHELGFHVPYSKIGTYLGELAFLSILVLAFKRGAVNWKGTMRRFVFALLIYYLLASTVHPWYLIVPLFLSVFTDCRVFFAWSVLVFLSYARYSSLAVEYTTLTIFVEYLLVFVVLVLDLRRYLSTRKVLGG
jgi:alpha-1,6-mannosyltransferase